MKNVVFVFLTIGLLSCIILFFEFGNLLIRSVVHCPSIHFSYTKWPLTALVSFPGSGNTWTRYLIERVTGIATGSVYCSSLIKDEFIGECSKEHNVLVIKTHSNLKKNKIPFKKAIILIRNPYKAIISEFNRSMTRNKTGFASYRKYKEKFKDFATKKMQLWRNLYMSWIYFPGQKHVLIYEKLKQDIPSEIQKLLKFLNVSVKMDDFKCLLQDIEGKFHRPNLTFNPMNFYTKTMKKKMKSVIESIERLPMYHNVQYS